MPCAVKIINGGSSIGVELPDTREELAQTLERMLAYGNHVIVEKKIKGREIQVAVLGDTYLPAVEIIPGGLFRLFLQVSEGRCPGDLPAPHHPGAVAHRGRAGPAPAPALTWASIPGRTSFWMRRGTSGAWRSTPSRA